MKPYLLAAILYFGVLTCIKFRCFSLSVLNDKFHFEVDNIGIFISLREITGPLD